MLRQQTDIVSSWKGLDSTVLFDALEDIPA